MPTQRMRRGNESDFQIQRRNERFFRQNSVDSEQNHANEITVGIAQDLDDSLGPVSDDGRRN